MRASFGRPALLSRARSGRIKAKNCHFGNLHVKHYQYGLLR
jgi:hypothetical protein